MRRGITMNEEEQNILSGIKILQSKYIYKATTVMSKRLVAASSNAFLTIH